MENDRGYVNYAIQQLREYLNGRIAEIVTADGKQVQMQVTATYIQWKYATDVSWTDLIALSEITGADGADGADNLIVQDTAPEDAAENEVWIDSDYTADAGKGYFLSTNIWKPIVCAASDIPYDNSTSDLTAEDVQAAIDEIRADTMISNTVITNNLYAEYGDIAELTVDRLLTINKVARYWAADTSEANYIRMQDQTYQAITGTTDGSTTQLTDRNGNLLYWKGAVTAATYMLVGMSTTPTMWPVTVYDYEELVKMTIGHAYDVGSGYWIPQIILGAGDGVTANSAKAFIYKNVDGLELNYYTPNDSELRQVKLGDNGIFGTGLDVCETATNSDAVSVITTETSAISKTLTLDVRSRIVVWFSGEIVISGGAANVSAITYIDGIAMTYQPTLYCGDAQSYVLSYSDFKEYVPVGEITVEVKLLTDANAGNISIGHAKLIVQAYAEPLPSITDVSGFTATAISTAEIDLLWTNPMSLYFNSVEIYQSTVDISAQTRTWCATNLTAIYTGTGTSYNNTGLTAVTTYYYKIFAKYIIADETYYSSGVSANGETLVAAYQKWSGYPDSLLATAEYPHQLVFRASDLYILYMSKAPLYAQGAYFGTSGECWKAKLIGGAWTDLSHSMGQWFSACTEANNPVYTDSTLTTVFFAKTTA